MDNTKMIDRLTDISTKYARQNGALTGSLKAILNYFEDMDKDLIKDYLEELIENDKKFDLEMKEMQNEIK
jgi:hypothetical protein